MDPFTKVLLGFLLWGLLVGILLVAFGAGRNGRGW